MGPSGLGWRPQGSGQSEGPWEDWRRGLLPLPPVEGLVLTQWNHSALCAPGGQTVKWAGCTMANSRQHAQPNLSSACFYALFKC